MKKTAASILVFLASTARGEDTIKDKDMYEMMFGIPNGDPSIANILISNIPGYIQPFMTYSLILAAAALSVILLFVFLFGGMDTAKQAKLLGNQVGVEKMALRIGVASFLLVPVSGGMTIGGLIILASSGFVSKGLDELNAQAQEAVIGDAIASIETVPPVINRKEWGQLLRSLICMEYSIKKNNLSSYTIPPLVTNFNQPDDLIKSNGNVFYLAGVTIPGSTRSWIWSANVDYSACGGFVAETKTPDPDRPNSNAGAMGRLLNIVSAGARGITGGVGASVSTHTRSYRLADGGDTLRKLAWAIVNNELTPNKDDSLEKKMIASRKIFDQTFIDINQKLKQVHERQVQQIVPLVESSVQELQQEMVDDGWMMAWANAFKLTNIASIIEPLSATRIRVYVRDSSFFDEKTINKIGELESIARSAEGADIAQSPALSTYPTINANAGNDSAYDHDGKIRLTSSRYCEDAIFNYTCLGKTTMEQLMFLSQELKNTREAHPLVTLNGVGSAVSSDAFNHLIFSGLAVNLLRSVAYGLQSIPGPWTKVPGRILEDKINDGYDVYTTIQKIKYYLFKAVQILPSALIALAGIIVNVDWVVTLFIMLFAVHLYAIFNALPRGGGVTSDYAQRGIPAFLGAIFMPFYNLTFLYVALLVMKFAFPFLGSSFMVFLGFTFSYTDVGWIDALLYTAFFIIGVLAIMKLCLYIMTNGPDRILKLLGVHEALTSGFTTSEAESRSTEKIRQAGESTQRIAAPLREVHKDREPVPAQRQETPPGGTPHSGGGSPPPPMPSDTRKTPSDEHKPYTDTNANMPPGDTAPGADTSGGTTSTGGSGASGGGVAPGGSKNTNTGWSPSGVRINNGVADFSDVEPEPSWGERVSERLKSGASRITAATKAGFGMESYDKAFSTVNQRKPPVREEHELPMDLTSKREDGSHDSGQKREEIDQVKSEMKDENK